MSAVSASGIEADKFHALCLPVLEFIKLEHGHAKKSLGAPQFSLSRLPRLPRFSASPLHTRILPLLLPPRGPLTLHRRLRLPAEAEYSWPHPEPNAKDVPDLVAATVDSKLIEVLYLMNENKIHRVYLIDHDRRVWCPCTRGCGCPRLTDSVAEADGRHPAAGARLSAGGPRGS